MSPEEKSDSANLAGQTEPQNLSPYGAHTDAIIKSFSENQEVLPLITSAEAILRGIATGVLPVKEADAALNELEAQDVTGILYSSFGDRDQPLLAAMRAAVENDLELLRVNKQGVNEINETTTARPATEMGPLSVPSLPKDEFVGREFPRDFTFMRSHGDMELLWNGTTGVHISRTSLCNVPTIKAIISACPNLQFLQIPPSLIDNNTGPGIRQLLEEHGIELRVGRVKESRQYDIDI